MRPFAFAFSSHSGTITSRNLSLPTFSAAISKPIYCCAFSFVVISGSGTSPVYPYVQFEGVTFSWTKGINLDWIQGINLIWTGGGKWSRIFHFVHAFGLCRTKIV